MGDVREFRSKHAALRVAQVAIAFNRLNAEEEARQQAMRDAEVAAREAEVHAEALARAAEGREVENPEEPEARPTPAEPVEKPSKPRRGTTGVAIRAAIQTMKHVGDYAAFKSVADLVEEVGCSSARVSAEIRAEMKRSVQPTHGLQRLSRWHSHPVTGDIRKTKVYAWAPPAPTDASAS